MTNICAYCSEPFDPDSDVNPTGEGYWCNCCDYYNYFDAAMDERHFQLVLEGKSSENETLTYSPKVKLKKRLSPLRYPGGKSKIIDFLLPLIKPTKTELLSSPYTGGGSFEFALLESGLVKKLALNDRDFGIYALFELIKTFPDFLLMEIKRGTPTYDDFIHAQKKVKGEYENCDLFDAAWSVLLVNRLAFSGIYKANPMGGKRRDKNRLLSRWNPEALCKRISILHCISDRYTIQNKDALEFIEEQYWYMKSTLFIDPPYVDQGKHLYLHYYTEDDNRDLKMLLEGLYHEYPCADLIVTYDDHPLINQIYESPSISHIKRKFSV